MYRQSWTSLYLWIWLKWPIQSSKYPCTIYYYMYLQESVFYFYVVHMWANYNVLWLIQFISSFTHSKIHSNEVQQLQHSNTNFWIFLQLFSLSFQSINPTFVSLHLTTWGKVHKLCLFKGVVCLNTAGCLVRVDCTACTCTACSIAFISPNRLLCYWLLHGHMTSFNLTVSRQIFLRVQHCKVRHQRVTCSWSQNSSMCNY